jgi:predicted  nucleic acid-binding Zn-ribbon protein
MLLEKLLAEAHARAARYHASERPALTAQQRVAIDAVHTSSLATLTARRDWLASFEAAARDDAEGALLAARECFEVNTSWARHEANEALKAVRIARADEARRALTVEDAPIWRGVLDLVRNTPTGAR